MNEFHKKQSEIPKDGIISDELSEKVIKLSPDLLTDRRNAHKYLKEKFGFPEYYGHNLDAFHDCLMEAGECTVIWEKTEQVPVYAEKILRVLKEAAKDNPRIHIIIK